MHDKIAAGILDIGVIGLNKFIVSKENDRPPSLRDVAAAAGVSLATTSLALRNSEQIAPATRDRVKQAAEKLGYLPNPLAAAFHREIRKRNGVKYRANLAWINDQSREDRWSGHEAYESARARARELGYEIDVIHIDSSVRHEHPDELVANFTRVLHARGIHGAILPELALSTLATRAWPDIAVVLLGHYEGWVRNQPHRHPGRAPFHRVAADVAWNTMEAIGHLRQRCAGKIGFVTTRWQNLAFEEASLGAYLARQFQDPPESRVPPLMIDDVRNRRDEETFRKWFRQHQPEGLLFSNHEVIDWLKRMKVAVPGECRLAHLDVAYEGEAVSGMNSCLNRQGEVAVDMLTAALQRNERQIPAYPKSMLVPGIWQDGGTA